MTTLEYILGVAYLVTVALAVAVGILWRWRVRRAEIRREIQRIRNGW